MNIGITKEEDSPLKQQQQQDGNTKDGKINNKASSSTSSPWLRLKDPRIVRVSRAFGGKDRHSKVCTIRGLRDRRVRLSVPTAIQLYDLQDRLGLNQPSKVVDWLLNAAKQEIDELPPLPVAPMNFTLNHHEIAANSLSSKQGFKISNWGDLNRQDFWSNESLFRAKEKQAERDTTTDEKKNWMKRTQNDNQQDQRNEGQLVRYDHRGNSHSNCSSSGLMNNSTIVPYESYLQLDHHPSFRSSHLAGFVSQITTDHDLHNLNVNSMPLPTSALSLSSGSQIFAPQTYFPAVHNFAASADTDPRQINQFQMFCSNTQLLFPNSLTNTSNPYSMNDQSSASSRGFHFNIAPRLFNSNSTEGSQEANKDQDFLCK